jgi:hypothetical protein
VAALCIIHFNIKKALHFSLDFFIDFVLFSEETVYFPLNSIKQSNFLLEKECLLWGRNCIFKYYLHGILAWKD